MVRKTRKVQKSKSKKMTVPQLRCAFVHMAKLVEKGISVDAFRKEWKKVFGKEVSMEGAKEYLDFMAKNKKQRGGMAPLGYDLRAGLDNMGSYPKYVSGGFGFANTNSIQAGCGNEDITPRVPASLGNAAFQTGGKKRKTRRSQNGGASGWQQFQNNMSEVFQRPFQTIASPVSTSSGIQNIPPALATGLPTRMQDLQMAWKGYPTNDNMPSPRPEIPAFNFRPYQAIYGAYMSPDSKQV